MTATIPTDQPTVKLIGQNGNAFAILAVCRQAARRASWSHEEIEAFTAEASAGDYDHLLATVMKYFDVE